jgi:hypothetical protein
MAYAFAAHDQNLIDTLSSAKFVEEQENHELFITFAHLTGRVWFSDGVMYWKTGSGSASGEKRVNPQDIDRSAASLLNYGRAAVKNELAKTAKRVIADARARIARQ